MKNLPIVFLVIAASLSGCGKKEEPAAAVTPAAVAPAAPAQAPEAAKPVPAAPAAPAAPAPVAATAPEQPKATLMDQATGAAMQLASSVDWANLSWDKVAEIPYDDKDQLLAWAAPQIDTLKDQLSNYMMTQGTSALANLGDTGWQGAIKGAVSALESVKESSPETWEMARGGLIMAWDALKSEATKQMGGG